MYKYLLLILIVCFGCSNPPPKYPPKGIRIHQKIELNNPKTYCIIATTHDDRDFVGTVSEETFNQLKENSTYYGTIIINDFTRTNIEDRENH